MLSREQHTPPTRANGTQIQHMHVAAIELGSQAAQPLGDSKPLMRTFDSIRATSAASHAKATGSLAEHSHMNHTQPEAPYIYHRNPVNTFGHFPAYCSAKALAL
jgi:hypothetical protein